MLPLVEQDFLVGLLVVESEGTAGGLMGTATSSVAASPAAASEGAATKDDLGPAASVLSQLSGECWSAVAWTMMRQ